MNVLSLCLRLSLSLSHSLPLPLQTEVGVVLFGLPESETANKLNDDDNSDYLGVKEYCM